MAINFSHNMAKLPPEVRKASRNTRTLKGDRWASGRYYEVEAQREAPLPWARPRTQVFRVKASEHPGVIKRLERDGWATRSRKLRRGTV